MFPLSDLLSEDLLSDDFDSFTRFDEFELSLVTVGAGFATTGELDLWVSMLLDPEEELLLLLLLEELFQFSLLFGSLLIG